MGTKVGPSFTTESSESVSTCLLLFTTYFLVLAAKLLAFLSSGSVPSPVTDTVVSFAHNSTGLLRGTVSNSNSFTDSNGFTK